MKGKQKQIKPPEQVIKEPVPTTRQEKLQDFLRKVQNKVVTLIDSDDVVIPKHKIPFTEGQKQQSTQFSVKLKLVQQTREKMKSRLQVIAQQQQKLKWQQKKKQLVESRQKTLSPMGIKTKSQLSKEDLKLLKKLKDEQKQFQQSLQLKTAEYNAKIEEMKKEEQMLKEKQIKEQVQGRKKQIAQRLENLQKQKLERQKQFEDEKRKMVEIKAKRKLFQEMQHKQKELQRIQMQKKINTFQSRMKNQEIDLHNLKQHEERYQEIKAQKDLERLKRKEEINEMAKEKVPHFQKSKFHTIILNQTKKRKQEEYQQRQHKLQMIEAAKDYAQTVKRQYAPRLKTHSSSSGKSKEKVQGLSFEQVKYIGNNYFQQMKLKIKHKKLENRDSQLNYSNDVKINQPQKTFTTKYRDYLSERRQFKQKRGQDNRMNKTGDPRIKDRFIRKQLEQVCKQASNMDSHEGLQKLRAFAIKLETQRGKQDHLLLDKITAKLRILQSLSKN